MIYEKEKLNLRRSFSSPLYPNELFKQPLNKNLKDLNKLQSDPLKNMNKSSLSHEIKVLFSSFPCNEFEPFSIPTSRVLTRLINWEFLSEKETTEAIEAFKLISQSKIQAILCESRFLEKIILLIDSDNIPLKIQKILVKNSFFFHNFS